MEFELQDYLKKLEVIRIRMMRSHHELYRLLNMSYNTYNRLRDPNNTKPPAMKTLRNIKQFVDENQK